MSRGFNWFKGYEIYLADELYHNYNLRYIDGGSTSHSPGNITDVQDLLEKYGGITIPYVETIGVYDIPEFIEPKTMSEVCDVILHTAEVDEVDQRDRIEWFKKLSDDGYYLSYDWY